MNVKSTIVDKFMKAPQDETIEKAEDTMTETLEMENIPDEFTSKLMVDSEENFPSINEIQEEESKEYVYLDDDELSRDFLMDRDLTKQYRVQLVMYHVNEALETPFLEFYLEKSDEIYSFPEKNLDNEKLKKAIDEIQQTQQGGMDIQTEQHGDIELGVKTTISNYEDMNAFEQQVFELFNEKTGYSDIIAENAYKGFVEHEEIIYVLFENKNKVIVDSETKHIWSILDEILAKKSVLNTPIQNTAYQLFSENVKLAHITLDGQVVDIPLVVYPVDKINNIYENIYYNADDGQETYLITLPRETEDLRHYCQSLSYGG